MNKWTGSAGICINEEGKLLMVLQGAPDEEKTWSVPSGGREVDETYQACCLREVEEETGYQTEVSQFIKVKTGYYNQPQLAYEVHYFLLNKIAGQMNIQDPDQLIYEIAWKSIEEIRSLKMDFPEDRTFLIL